MVKKCVSFKTPIHIVTLHLTRMYTQIIQLMGPRTPKRA